MKRVAPTFGEYLFEKLVQLVATVFVTVLLFLPAELMYVIYHITNLVGFWQNLALTGLELFFLGSIQFALFFVWITMLGHIYTMFD
jgi:hypothetical protein